MVQHYAGKGSKRNGTTVINQIFSWVGSENITANLNLNFHKTNS
uniref:Uncharacterized protein n=1 Tax=Arundo donax TaxID=35708 RepID=A0A0A9BS29_ARUDO